MSADAGGITLAVSERYPFVHETSVGGVHVNAPSEQVDRWVRVMAEFDQVQDEMKTAHDEAWAVELEASRIKQAEFAVAEAQAQLDMARWEQEHPPHLDTTWPELDGDGNSVACWFPPFGSAREAYDGRVHQYDRKDRLGVAMSFDLQPYTCPDGHWHLGRVEL